jgi:hypothetical protein
MDDFMQVHITEYNPEKPLTVRKLNDWLETQLNHIVSQLQEIKETGSTEEIAMANEVLVDTKIKFASNQLVDIYNKAKYYENKLFGPAYQSIKLRLVYMNLVDMTSQYTSRLLTAEANDKTLNGKELKLSHQLDLELKLIEDSIKAMQESSNEFVRNIASSITNAVNTSLDGDNVIAKLAFYRQKLNEYNTFTRLVQTLHTSLDHATTYALAAKDNSQA